MLNPFPMFLIYSLVAPFVLRVVAGFIFLDLGILSFNGEKKFWLIALKTLRIPAPKLALRLIGIVQIIGSLMLIVGFYTQIAALVLGLLTLAEAMIEYKDPAILKRSLVFYVLLFAITFSLFLSGAGAFAFDFPL